MQVTYVKANNYNVSLEPDETPLLGIFIEGMQDPSVKSVEDLIALFLCTCCERCTDHMNDPCQRLSESQLRQKEFADRLNDRFKDAF